MGQQQARTRRETHLNEGVALDVAVEFEEEADDLLRSRLAQAGRVEEEVCAEVGLCDGGGVEDGELADVCVGVREG